MDIEPENCITRRWTSETNQTSSRNRTREHNEFPLHLPLDLFAPTPLPRYYFFSDTKTILVSSTKRRFVRIFFHRFASITSSSLDFSRILRRFDIYVDMHNTYPNESEPLHTAFAFETPGLRVKVSETPTRAHARRIFIVAIDFPSKFR